MAGEKVETVDIEALKKKTNLTPAESDILAEEAMEESAKEAKLENETPEEKAEREKTEKETQETESRKDLDVRAKEAGLEEGASEEDIKAKELEDGKRQETEEEVKNREKAEAEAKEVLDKEVKDYASENKVSEEEARKELEHISKVGEKYGNDPKKLSKANLHLQRDYVKAQEQLKAGSRPKPLKAEEIPLEGMVKLIEEGKLTSNGKALTKEHILESFRKQYSDITEGLEDDKVIKMAAKELREKFVENDKEQLSKISDLAKTRRTELINTLPEEDKEFLPKIQPILENTPDVQVIQEGYGLEDLIRWARGDKDAFKKSVDEAYQRGLKKGKEEAKIVGEKTLIGDGKPPVKTDTKSSKISALTAKQRERALDMYDTDAMTEEQKFLAYIEYIESDKKK